MSKFSLPNIPNGSILGLNYSGMHDSTVAVVTESGGLVFACALERLTRVKQDGRPPVQLLDVLPLEHIKTIAVSTNERPLSTGQTYSRIHPVPFAVPRPTSLIHGPEFEAFVNSIPGSKVFIDHHLCHAHSAFWMSGFAEALCLTYDGGMCNSPWFGGVYAADRKHGVSPSDLFSASHHPKITSLYSFVTALLGFTPNKHEGKITGLAAYGKPNRDCCAILEEILLHEFFLAEEIAEWIFVYSKNTPPVLAVNEAKRRHFLNRFSGFSKEDIAASVQYLSEEHVLAILRNMSNAGVSSDNICLAGGLFANVKINQRVKEFGYRNIFVAPPMTDDGTALGAALCVASESHSFQPRKLEHMFLGPSYDENEILKSLREFSLTYQEVDDPVGFLAGKLAEGAIVGVFQGPMEFGPRALGNRSILSQATRPEINKELNAKLNRTEFMPFAPMTRLEDVESCYVQLQGAEHTAEFMTITTNCTDKMRKECPAVVHVDGTARPQIVREEQSPFIYELITRYKRITNLPSIINTSFNIHEEPIVCSPGDAIEGFLESGLDYLYFEGGIVVEAGTNQRAALELLRRKRGKPTQKELKLQALNVENQTRLLAAHHEMTDKEREILSLREALEGRLRAIEAASVSLKEKEAEISSTQNVAEERLKAIEAASVSLKEKEVEIAAIQEKEAEIASTQRVAQERARQLIEKEAMIGSLYAVAEEDISGDPADQSGTRDNKGALDLPISGQDQTTIGKNARQIRDRIKGQIPSAQLRGFCALNTKRKITMKAAMFTKLILVCAAIAIVGCEKHDSQTGRLKDRIDFTDPNLIRNSGALGVYEDGWMGTEAEIMLGNPSHQPAILIEGTNVQTRPGDEALGILLLVGSDTIQVLNILALGDFHEMAILPQKIRSNDSLDVTLIATKTFVPSKLGTSRDDRSLSFRLKSVSLVGLDVGRSAFPSAFEFPGTAETDPNVQGIYSDGWIGDSASVTLFNPEKKATVEIRGVVPGSIFQGVATLDVLFEGTLLVRQQVSGNFRMRFQLPDAIRGDAKLSFTLKPSGSFVPAERGINSDKRRISYQMQFIGLK